MSGSPTELRSPKGVILNSPKGDATGAVNKRRRSLMEALTVLDISEDRTTADDDDDMPCLRSKLAVTAEDKAALREWSEKTGVSVESEPKKNPDDTHHREYLRKIFAELRQEGLRELEDGDTIFEMKGEEPQTRLFRRFGSSPDRLMYVLCRFIAMWDIVCVLPLLCFGDIMRVGIVRRWAFLRLFEIAMVAFYVYGVFLRFFTSIVDVTKGAEYVDLTDIFTRHVTSWTLWADIVSLVGNLWWVWPDWWFIAGFRLLRVWRLPSTTNHTYLITTGRTESPVGMLIELSVALWIVAHVFGCLWFYADTLQMEYEVNELKAHKVVQSVFKKEDEFAEEVLDSFIRNTGFAYLEYMKAGSAMLVGWNGPEPKAAVLWTRSEMLFWIVVAPVAAMYMTALYAWLLMIIERLGANANRHNETVSKLGAILNSLRVPPSLRKRVLQYHAFLSLHNIDTAAYDVLFTGLSSNLHVETKLFLFENLVLTATFFEDVPAQYMMQLVSSLEEAVYSPGDMIVHKGQVGEELFFIIKGSCEVVIDDDATVVVGVKHPGEHFGEIALVLDQPRTAWIRAKVFSVLAKLRRAELEHILENVPEVKAKMVNSIMKQCNYKQTAPAPPKPGSKMDIELKYRDMEALKSEPHSEPRVEPRLSLTGYGKHFNDFEQAPSIPKVDTHICLLSKVDNQILDLQIGQADITQAVRQLDEAVQVLMASLGYMLQS